MIIFIVLLQTVCCNRLGVFRLIISSRIRVLDKGELIRKVEN